MCGHLLGIWPVLCLYQLLSKVSPKPTLQTKHAVVTEFLWSLGCSSFCKDFICNINPAYGEGNILKRVKKNEKGREQDTKLVCGLSTQGFLMAAHGRVPMAVLATFLCLAALIVGAWIATAKCLQISEERRQLREAQRILRNGRTMFKYPKVPPANKKPPSSDEIFPPV